jgi:hypothetical protein
MSMITIMATGCIHEREPSKVRERSTVRVRSMRMTPMRNSKRHVSHYAHLADTLEMLTTTKTRKKQMMINTRVMSTVKTMRIMMLKQIVPYDGAHGMQQHVV